MLSTADSLYKQKKKKKKKKIQQLDIFRFC